MHSLVLSPHSHVHILPFTCAHNTQTHIRTSHTSTHHTHISHITHTLPPSITLCLPTQGVSCRGVAGRWARSIRREYTLFVTGHTHKGKKKGTLEWSTLKVRVFKIDAAIRNAFPKCVCGVTPPQTGRLLPKIGRLLPRIGKFFPKNRKASSEECWVRTRISFRNAVQLRLRIFCVRV